MENLNLIYYSPTGTTQKVVKEIGKNLGLNLLSEINLAKESFAKNESELLTAIDGDCLTIIGMPVYAGRLPLPVIEILQKLLSNESPVVLVVVFGNRAYEDSLLELKDIASNCGFKTIAAAAFIGEHSYSYKEQPIAKDRPDSLDLEKCAQFAHLITDKLKSSWDIKNMPEVKIPGNYPYKERKIVPATVHPQTDNDLCTLCGICADSCPTNAITIQETVLVDGELCTLCCACVKNCPEDAITLNHPAISAIRDNLFINFATREEPVYFI